MLIKETKLKDRIEWTIDDPKNGNSLGMRMYDRFHELLTSLEKECERSIHGSHDDAPTTRLLVIKANYDGSQAQPIWVAGGNLKELASLNQAEARNYIKNYSMLCRRLLNLPIPVLFAMDGQVIGGGVELALFGDLRFATASTTFSFKQLRVGLALGYGSSNRLTQLIGPSSAMDYLLLQKVIGAKELLAKGLIQKELSSVGELDEAIANFSANLSQLEPLAVAMQKRMLNRAFLSLNSQVEQDLDDFSKLWKNPSHLKFLDHFLKGESNEPR
ncbi:MAG: enoyl-CoA hydratase/isomerase family protein [Oligoflexales bacterium]